MIRKLLCIFGWHEWKMEGKLKPVTEESKLLNPYLRNLLCGTFDITYTCKHCGKVRK
jgi:hypothetical protein